MAELIFTPQYGLKLTKEEYRLVMMGLGEKLSYTPDKEAAAKLHLKLLEQQKDILEQAVGFIEGTIKKIASEQQASFVDKVINEDH